MINYHIFVRLIINSFCKLDYKSENSGSFWSDTGQTLLLGYVHEACPILTIKTQQYMCKIDAV